MTRTVLLNGDCRDISTTPSGLVKGDGIFSLVLDANVENFTEHAENMRREFGMMMF